MDGGAEALERATTLSSILIALLVHICFMVGVVASNWVAQVVMFERFELYG